MTTNALLHPVRSRAARLLTSFLVGLIACRPTADQRVASLERRVDSLAISLTTLKAILDRGAPDATPRTLTVGAAGAAALGRRDAPVTIVEFTDYQCPFCARHATVTFPELKRKYIDTGKVRYVIRDNPLPIHPFAPKAAKAARCAGAQQPEAYWEFHAALFAEQRSLADSTFPALARRYRLDPARFAACLASDTLSATIGIDVTAARRGQLQGTPAFIIGVTAADSITGAVIPGAYDFARFSTTIDSILRKEIALAK